MKHLLYTILFLVLITACKKQSMVVIQAQNYTNTTDGSAYAGMKYTVLESWTPVFELKTNKIVSGTLDANGHAAFELKMKNNRKYDLGIQQPENMCYTEVTIQERLKHQDNNTINFNYAPCGFVKIPTNNINCEGVDDKMQYKYYYSDNPDIYIYRGFSNSYEWSENTFVKGCISYPGGREPVPTGNYTFEWRIIRPSGTITGIDYFTVTENDTTTYILEY